eukprot:601838-Pyramimonas_sp.AAC.1
MLIPPKAPNKTVGYLPVGYWKPPHGYGEKVSYLLMRGAGSSSDILPILLSSVASLASKPG